VGNETNIEVLREMFAVCANERRMKEADAIDAAIAALSTPPSASMSVTDAMVDAAMRASLQASHSGNGEHRNKAQVSCTFDHPADFPCAICYPNRWPIPTAAAPQTGVATNIIVGAAPQSAQAPGGEAVAWLPTEDSDGDWYADGRSIHVDWNDGTSARQMSLILKPDGKVGFAIYWRGDDGNPGYASHGTDINDPRFLDALRGLVHPAALPADGGKVGDWRIDNSTPNPILVYQNCSVIQDEQARYVLNLVRADQGLPADGYPKGAIAIAQIEHWERAHPRAVKLLRKDVPFFVVKASEPYAWDLVRLFRAHEGDAWTAECQQWAEEAIGSPEPESLPADGVRRGLEQVIADIRNRAGDLRFMARNAMTNATPHQEELRAAARGMEADAAIMDARADRLAALPAGTQGEEPAEATAAPGGEANPAVAVPLRLLAEDLQVAAISGGELHLRGMCIEAYKRIGEILKSPSLRAPPAGAPAEGGAVRVPSDADLIRAWRNRFITERCDAYRQAGDGYEIATAKAEGDAKEYEQHFIATSQRLAASSVGGSQGDSDGR
jgi:hypothetical protein